MEMLTMNLQGIHDQQAMQERSQWLDRQVGPIHPPPARVNGSVKSIYPRLANNPASLVAIYPKSGINQE
jgi:hypothetical protein